MKNTWREKLAEVKNEKGLREFIDSQDQLKDSFISKLVSKLSETKAKLEKAKEENKETEVEKLKEEFDNLKDQLATYHRSLQEEIEKKKQELKMIKIKKKAGEVNKEKDSEKNDYIDTTKNVQQQLDFEKIAELEYPYTKISCYKEKLELILEAQKEEVRSGSPFATKVKKHLIKELLLLLSYQGTKKKPKRSLQTMKKA